MSWEDRLNPAITLQSPSGQVFVAAWRGDSRSLKKKLGIFDLPKVRGAIVQDLDVQADEYPLTFYFEGENHDITARRFWGACKERGTWLVGHPVYGDLELQLVSVTEDCQPVESGNITKITTDWIEPGVDAPLVSVAELSASVRDQAAKVQEVAANRFADTVMVGKPGLLAQLKAAVGRVVAIVQQVKGRINAVLATVSAIRAVVLSAVAFTVGLVASLAGLIHTLVTLPGMLIRDLGSRFDYFEKVLSESVKSLTPTNADDSGRNTAAVHELVAVSCLVGLAESVVEAEFATREEALAYLNRMQRVFNTITANLDAIQAIYAGNTIDQQYVSLADGYNDIAALMQATIDLMLRRTFDLAAAKRIILERHRPPVEIALSEGVDLDLFISANRLKGDDILLLPPGREVVVYL